LTRSLPPSHILQDGRSVYLPPPTEVERARFLERCIAKHGLLNSDLSSQQHEGRDKKDKDGDKETEKDGGDKEDNDESAAQKIHPLATASARLNSNGINELSKAINLSGLVSSDQYFGLSNIVDPSLERTTAGIKGETSSSVVAKDSTSEDMEENESQLRAAYIGKRKRDQFVKATEFLEKQQERLAASVLAQSVMDDRLQQLRKRWRLVAPEHGTRAKPHAVRPTEIVALDVDVYDRDRTGGGSQALKQGNDSNKVQGRIARRVPRFAVVELNDDYSVDMTKWMERCDKKEDEKKNSEVVAVTPSATKNEAEGSTSAPNKDSGDKKKPERDCQTRAEPFAVADPTLGKIDVDFRPENVPMLTLELSIEKASTGFYQNACLSPMFSETETPTPDEKVVVALQHSLFCASLFESIRRELADQVGDGADSNARSMSTHQQSVWLSSEVEENFVPAPSQMAGGGDGSGVASLCIVHCHEGEVKVQLDSEYSLTVKLIEADTSKTDDSSMDVDPTIVEGEGLRGKSGSQSPAHLKALCRALLLHIQDVYHKHSMETRALELKEKQRKEKPAGLATIKKAIKAPSPHILQNCIVLGGKIIFERKVRWVLKRIKQWIKNDLHSDTNLDVVWLPCSVFDLQSHVTVCFQDFCVDVSVDRDGMNVTSTGNEDEYQNVEFNSDVEFEIFLKLQIRRRLDAIHQLKKTPVHMDSDIVDLTL